MKLQSTSYQNINQEISLNSLSNTTIIDAEFYTEKEDQSKLANLYIKHDDEPDFDCEFLHGISYDYKENTIDLDPEEDETDEYNDNQWEADIYDPYLESTYF